MKLDNPFTDDTRRLFFYNYECFWCKQNGWDAAHHILGRVSNSPLNFCPIHNIKCHIGNYELDSFEAQSKLLKQTLRFLLADGYILTEEDKQFKKEYARFYT
jgi:hypothetical protein